MDEMVLRSKMMRRVFAGFIMECLSKKGFEGVDISIHELNIGTKEDGVVGLHLHVDTSAPVKTIKKMYEMIRRS